MIKIAICDDQKYYINSLRKALEQYPADIDIKGFADRKELIKSMHQTKYNIVFMDIMLEEDKTGIDVCKHIKLIQGDILIIYVSSAINEYKNDLLQGEPFRCLEKPVTFESLRLVMDAAIRRLKDKDTIIFKYKLNGLEYNINLNEVYYFKTHLRLINIVSKDGTAAFYERLDNIADSITEKCPYFIRISKNCLINYKKVKRISNFEFESEGRILNISRAYKKDVECKIKAYLTSIDTF